MEATASEPEVQTASPDAGLKKREGPPTKFGGPRANPQKQEIQKQEEALEEVNDPPASIYETMLKVYSTPQRKDRTTAERTSRKFLNKHPAQFVAQLRQMEKEERERKDKEEATRKAEERERLEREAAEASARLQAQEPVLPSPDRVLENDAGQERTEELLEKLLAGWRRKEQPPRR